MRALADDPGHWTRVENEAEVLQRCNDNCDEDEKPEPDPEFEVPPEWSVDPKMTKTLTWGTALAAGGYLISEYWWLLVP